MATFLLQVSFDLRAYIRQRLATRRLPFKDPDSYARAARVQSRESVEVSKAVANYVYDTYGRFPKVIDPIFCPTQVQLAHIDVDLYEKYYLPGTLWPELREHLEVWHQ